MRFSRLVLALLLPLAAVPALGAAEPTDPPDMRAAVPARLEVSAGAGVGGTSPAIGMLASLPVGDRLSFDLGADYLFRVFRSPAYALAQAQQVATREMTRAGYIK